LAVAIALTPGNSRADCCQDLGGSMARPAEHCKVRCDLWRSRPLIKSTADGERVPRGEDR
jgi:hypothetical protein